MFCVADVYDVMSDDVTDDVIDGVTDGETVICWPGKEVICEAGEKDDEGFWYAADDASFTEIPCDATAANDDICNDVTGDVIVAPSLAVNVFPDDKDDDGGDDANDKFDGWVPLFTPGEFEGTERR